jgi:hypothetical protein
MTPYLFFLVVLVFELHALSLLSRHYTLFYFLFQLGSRFFPGLALDCDPPTYNLLRSWDDRCTHHTWFY